jgi:hypothetical protein
MSERAKKILVISIELPIRKVAHIPGRLGYHKSSARSWQYSLSKSSIRLIPRDCYLELETPVWSSRKHLRDVCLLQRRKRSWVSSSKFSRYVNAEHINILSRPVVVLPL